MPVHFAVATRTDLNVPQEGVLDEGVVVADERVPLVRVDLAEALHHVHVHRRRSWGRPDPSAR